MRYQQRRRPAHGGFTIVELLVAMALIIFIMYILSEAFSAGATAFRNMKAVGDMNEKLRSTTTILRRYLQANHFEGHKRLSDSTFWNDGPPKEGFVRIFHGDAGTSEGNDLDSNPSFRTTTHGLHFTVFLRGNTPGDFFRAMVPYSTTSSSKSPLLDLPNGSSRYQDVPPITATEGVYAWPKAEVAVFMRRSNYQNVGSEDQTTVRDPNDPEAAGYSGLPLHTLYIRHRLLVPSNDEVSAVRTVNAGNKANYLEISHLDPDPKDNTKMYFNNAADVTMPARRFMMAGSLAGRVATQDYNTLAQDSASLAGYDVQLTNVLSFDVRVLFNKEVYSSTTQRFIDLHDTLLDSFVKTNKDINGTNKMSPVPRIFDTWSSRADNVYDYSSWQTDGTEKTIPMYGSNLRIRALQITIRIWDDRTQQTRQSSIVVDM